MVSTRPGGNFCEPVHPNRWSDEVVYKVYKDWMVIGECSSHVEAVQMLHKALSDRSEILDVAHTENVIIELDATLGVC